MPLIRGPCNRQVCPQGDGGAPVSYQPSRALSAALCGLWTPLPRLLRLALGRPPWRQVFPPWRPLCSILPGSELSLEPAEWWPLLVWGVCRGGEGRRSTAFAEGSTPWDCGHQVP